MSRLATTVIQRISKGSRWPLLFVALLLVLPEPATAQYFGRNKVQYDNFDFRILKTPHFDIHYYPEKDVAIEDVARMAERWYERFARFFQHEFETSKPLILYADHPDFQQTNTLGGMIGEGLGGVTEGLKDRVIMPLTGSYASTDHVLGHELVHAFQFNIAQSRMGGGLQGLMRTPLWMVEGMAEYLTVSQDDPLTTMWVKDALIRDDLPTLTQLTRDRRYFPYRWGHAFWTYVGSTYGDELVVQLFRRAIRVGWEPAIQQTLGVSSDSLATQWHRTIREDYEPLLEGRTLPSDAGRLILAPSTGSGSQNLSPAVSPDGRFVAFISEKDLFSIDIFIADVESGRIVRKLTSSSSDPHYDALRFIDSSGAWSPDGSRFAFSVFAAGTNQILVVDSRNGNIEKRLSPPVGAIANPSWSRDGRSIVFSGQSGGWSNLYLIDVETEAIRQLTNDRHADFQPIFSPDGENIVFTSDRGPETDFQQLTYSEFQLAILNLESGVVEPISIFGNVKHMNPQFGPDPDKLYFISDQDGFSDIYVRSFTTGEVRRVTSIATAVSGISANSPAMTVAANTGEVLFSVFNKSEFHIYAAEFSEGASEPVVAASPAPGRIVPPRDALAGRVANYLQDPHTGLAAEGSFSVLDAVEYDSSLQLDYIGQPSIGVGTDQFGGFVGGSAAAFFSDMLSNRVLAMAFQAQGTAKDIGGQAFYQNLENRWNWGVGAGRMPFMFMRSSGALLEDGSTVFNQLRQRLFVTSLSGRTAYPFSTNRRVEFGANLVRYSYDIEIESFTFFGNRLESHTRRSAPSELVPDALNLAQASVALVGDNSFSAFTSPVRGGRYRLEVQQTVGDLNFQMATLDVRRYFNPLRSLTIAARGVHFGRYGLSDREDRLQQFFLGHETFVRGYSAQSFTQAECTRASVDPGQFSDCAEFSRLFGHRLGVANLEVRVPLIGNSQFGLLNFAFVPTELLLFSDAGVAFNDFGNTTFEFDRTTAARVPVFSSGMGARFNVLGFLILEAHYVVPWQRPEKGGHWGFQLQPGW